MIGNSVAYHLVKRGWSDIVIIDKGTEIFIINRMDLFTAKDEEKNMKRFHILESFPCLTNSKSQ